MVYTIHSIENLRRDRIYYHDAVFFIDEITFDKQGGVFSLPMSRLLREGIVLKKSNVFFKIWLLPRMKSRLTLYQVHEMEKKTEYEKAYCDRSMHLFFLDSNNVFYKTNLWIDEDKFLEGYVNDSLIYVYRLRDYTWPLRVRDSLIIFDGKQ